tara:strand:- start:53 stop:262 length:210 start_codon:yes stop_codon:yes gene_type:complete
MASLKKLLKKRDILEEEIEDFDYMNYNDYGDFDNEMRDAQDKLEKVEEKIKKALVKEVEKYGGRVYGIE